MSDLLEFRDTIYRWIFEGILWIPVIAILGFILFGVFYAICGVLSNAEEIFEKVVGYPLGVLLGVLAIGSPVLVPLFIYYAGISESLWFPWLAAISGIFGLFVYSVIIYTYFFEDKKKNKAKKDESSEEVVGKDKHE